MLSFDDAKARIAKLPLPLSVETVPIWNAFGYFLAEDIHAVQDLPAWNNSAMDGYVFRYEDILEASEDHPVSLPLNGVVQAGDTDTHELVPNTCMRILTGAPTPRGADVVIMQENTTKSRRHHHHHQVSKNGGTISADKAKRLRQVTLF